MPIFGCANDEQFLRELMEDFTELKHCFRVEVYQYSTHRRFVSHDSFNTYEEAWEYGKKSTSQFGVCGYCVIECDEPELKVDLNFGDLNCGKQ